MFRSEADRGKAAYGFAAIRSTWHTCVYEQMVWAFVRRIDDRHELDRIAATTLLERLAERKERKQKKKKKKKKRMKKTKKKTTN